MLIVVFYMFIDGEKFIKYIYDLSPLPDEHDEKLFEKFMDMAGAVLIGNGLGGLIQGTAGGLLFLSLGFNSPFLWGVIMGFLAFLPIVGIGIVMIPAAVFLMLTSKMAAGIFVIVFYGLLSWGVEYLFKPKVVGDRVSMHPLIVFFAIIGGLKAYGLLGIIYGPLIATLFEQARAITSNIFNIVLYFGLMLIVVFYMFIDGEKFIKYIYDLSPLPDEHDEKLFEKFMDMAGAVLIGNGLGGLIQGTAGGLLFLSLGFNSPFLWGVIMGFLAFLPIVGIGIVMIPAAVFLMLTSKMAAGIFVIVFYGLLSWGVEYLFKPKVVGDRVSMHPLIVFFAIIGGLKAYGLLGIIYGPLIATLFLTLADIYFSSFQFMVEPEKVQKDNELEC